MTCCVIVSGLSSHMCRRVWDCLRRHKNAGGYHALFGQRFGVSVQEMLLLSELDWLKSQERPTFGVTVAMTHVVEAAGLKYEQQQSMDLEIRGALGEIGHCDDILRQPLPTAYTR